MAPSAASWGRTDQVAELVAEGARSVEQAQVYTDHADALRDGLACE
ncbi:MAG TPA: hypothetical protein VJ978_12985 [Nitriliruptoraceae bacterium]|nr:hypothetical protein [Nitriliruptoraceae bacterium]